jgi:Zn-dependent protease
MVNLFYILIVFIVIVVSMTLHEAMHAFTSYWLGDDTAKLEGRLTLNPIKHLDPFFSIILPLVLASVGAPVFGGAKPVPFDSSKIRFKEWGVALVALAGPLTNFIIAFLAFSLWVMAGAHNQGVVSQVLATVVSVNLGFFVFNLIPIPPLDGSRLLYALAPDFIRRGMEAMEKFGIVIVFLIVLIAGSTFSSLMADSINFFINFFGSIFGL